MKRLITCSNCDRYVREDETTCPFCCAELAEKGAPATGSAPAARGVGVAGRSRAAAFAMRAAIVAAAPGALACGGKEGTRPRDTRTDVASAGAQSAGASGAATGNAGQGSNTELFDDVGSSGAFVLDEPADARLDAGADAEPYAPIPIYGGVFPDPMSRARV